MIRTSKKGELLIPVLAVTLLMSLGAYQGARHLYGDTLLPFFKGFIANPRDVGTFLPCSVYVADEITNHLETEDDQVRVLEVGAGTGAFSTTLVKKLQSTGKPYLLDLVEIDQSYCQVLQEMFKDNPFVNVHCVSILDWAPNYNYHRMVTSLPFNLFPIQMLEQILLKYEDLMIPGGILSYVEYMGFAYVKNAFVFGDIKQEIAAKAQLLSQFKLRHNAGKNSVYLNIPPIYVYHLTNW